MEMGSVPNPGDEIPSNWGSGAVSVDIREGAPHHHAIPAKGVHFPVRFGDFTLE